MFKYIRESIGRRRGAKLLQSGLFDEEWYLAQYPEVREMGSPVGHYLTAGWKEGKNPSPRFHTWKYLYAYPDVRQSGMNPLVHYLSHGRAEGRFCFPCGGIGDLRKDSAGAEFMPLVSVIVTSYNYEDFIGEAIDSVLRQTYQNFEVIVVDDGSRDGSLEIVRRYAEANEKVRVYTHPNHENMGLPASVKLGVKMSKGEYVAFCESNDAWHPQHLEKVMELVRRYDDVKIVANHVRLIGDEEAVKLRTPYVTEINSFLSLGGNRIDLKFFKERNIIPTFSAVMIRKDVLSGLDFDTPIPAWLDFWLYRQILKDSYLYYVNQELTYWRLHASFNDVSKCEAYARKSAWFFYQSDVLNGIKGGQNFEKELNILQKSRYFDEAYYLRNYGDQIGGTLPAFHYLLIGWQLGYNPSESFCNDTYLAEYKDVFMSGINPLLHYERYGRKEKRKVRTVGESEKGGICRHDIELVRTQHASAKTVLLISHEFSQTGAPRALLNMGLMLKKRGVFPFVLSLLNGSLEDEVRDLGFGYVVEPFLSVKLAMQNQLVEEFLSCFDIVVFNTLDTVRLLQNFPERGARKICWLHEGRYSYDYFQTFLDIPSLFSKLDRIYAVGDYAKSFAVKQVEGKMQIGSLLYGIPDIALEEDKQVEEKDIQKLNLVLPGSLTIRKGQKVLLKALSLLPRSVRKQLNVYLVGPRVERKVERAIRHCRYSCVKYLGEMPHDDLLRLFKDMDVVLSPSLDDPMPIVCTEAMILQKAIIVSENTGTAAFIKNGVNGYKIPADDSKALAEAIKYVLAHREELPRWGKAARRIYDENFTMEVFERNVQELIIDA